MKPRGPVSGAAALLAALLGLVPWAQAQEHEVQGSGADTTEASASPGIQTLGEGESTIYLVDHGDSWSMHVQSVPTDELLILWQQVGGPEMVAKTIVNRPYTLSVHRLSAERILERVFDGYDYTLHYDAGGRLIRVRVYSLDSAAVFKTPRLVESLRDWSEKEIPASAESEDQAAESDVTDE